jgi:hypothetical protein
MADDNNCTQEVYRDQALSECGSLGNENQLGKIEILSKNNEKV